MIYVFYGLLIVGVLMLIADLAGRFVAQPDRVRAWRAIGLLAAAVAGLGPLLPLVTLTWTLPYPLIAGAYLVLFIAFLAGTLGAAGRLAISLQRAAYAGFLILGALPSWVLLPLSAAVALAGIALVRPKRDPEGRA